ncbi:SDR family oxidoreductase (plasmid) [Rhizobium sp. RCAM05350]|uniref:D-erythronate dehydrogenase n=1 Tax=Rhizobium sp. RCAM05350 TaxID=2895568 RepID=UPI0020767849|nr:D-erythronate dehydrogenase [Rhizobium sp. RCAM05350]URK89476.1 SDR family oxidoreductase [Rhizobium sp. RCAM05350]
MHIMIIGGAGMLGRKVAERLAKEGTLAQETVTELTLVDVFDPAAPAGFSGKLTLDRKDMSQPGVAAELAARRPDIIIHLAAIVSSEAEADFDKGNAVNLDGTRNLFEAIRLEGDDYRPRVIFTSSLAVFGAPLPDPIGDDYILAPLTSYGTQKAIGELLLSDYSRRGFFDGIGIRLPTICIRPGRPNRAASGFFSNILREPLKGEPAVLPVEPSVRHWFASPEAAVGFILHAAVLDSDLLGNRRNLTMPGVCASVAEQIEALRRVAGDEAVALIRREEDPAIAAIIAGWPRSFETKRADELGFVADASMDEIIRLHQGL